MTTEVDIVNRALQAIGTRTTVTAAELAANDTNEAIQANLVLHNIRDGILRMAPWNCAMVTEPLVYITSLPGTPENTSAAGTLWTPGLPPPPWSYEYQYPVDCQRACWITPQTATGYGGIPITPVTTGGNQSFLWGPPIKFKVQTDTFRPVTAAAVVSGGTGHAVGDIITLPGTVAGNAPIGAPVQLLVTAAPAGVISTVNVISQVVDANPPMGGSYFQPQTGTIAQASTTGSGINASFTLTFGAAARQRVILTDQEYALLNYIKTVTDPNLMDTLFQDCWTDVLAGTLCMALTGDIKKANELIKMANKTIEDARTPDGNEGLSINDVTPDWIRIRGVNYTEGYSGPYGGFNWGDLWPTY